MKKNVYWPDDEKNIYIEDRQKKILQELYPDYNYNCFVLWMIPEIISRFHDIEGKINLYRKDGTQINFDYMQNFPYPNKGIRQLSRTDGDTILNGIPLLFDSLEALRDISRIQVTWAVHFISRAKSVPTIYITQTNYDIDFWPAAEPAIYTMNMRDLFYNEPAMDKKSCFLLTEFLKEYEEMQEQIYTAESITKKEYKPCRILQRDEDDTLTHNPYFYMDLYSTKSIPAKLYADSKNLSNEYTKEYEALIQEMKEFQMFQTATIDQEKLYICKNQFFATETLIPYHYAQYLL